MPINPQMLAQMLQPQSQGMGMGGLPIQQVKDDNAVGYITVGNEQDAAKMKQQLQSEGRAVLTQPIGPNGIYGWEVKHWQR